MPDAVVGVTEAEATAQRLLSEHGAYSPIELLLATNSLTYEDYRAWRTGDCRTLDDALAAGVAGTRRLVEDVQSWARSLHLHPDHVPFYGVEKNAGVELTASADEDLEALLHTEYRAQADRRQTDIFLDASGMMAANDLVSALSSRDVTAAKSRLEHLVRTDAGHWMLANAATLVDALAEPPPGRRAEALRTMAALEQRWLPAASAVLRGGARDFVTPVWRAIGAALDDATPYDAARPKEHASFAYAHGLDWASVRRVVSEVANHRREPALLELLAESEWRLRNRREAVDLWFALCWVAPDHFASAVDAARFPDSAVRKCWGRLLDQDWSGPKGAAWLPAWMVLDEPGIGRAFKATQGMSAPERAFDLLLRLRAGGSDREDMDNRRALQELHPELFDRYLDALDT